MGRTTGTLLNHQPMERTTARLLNHQQVGGLAALYLAAAYLAAMPYFLLVLDYQSVVDPAAKLALLVAHQGRHQGNWQSRGREPSARSASFNAHYRALDYIYPK